MVLHELDLIREAVSGLSVGGGGGDGGGDGQQQVTTWRPSTTPVTIPRRKRGCGWNGDVQQKGQFVALGSRIPCPAWHALVCVFLFFASVRNSGRGGVVAWKMGQTPVDRHTNFLCRRVFLASHLMTITTFQPVVCEREREKEDWGKKICGRWWWRGGVLAAACGGIIVYFGHDMEEEEERWGEGKTGGGFFLDDGGECGRDDDDGGDGGWLLAAGPPPLLLLLLLLLLRILGTNTHSHIRVYSRRHTCPAQLRSFWW